MADINSKANIQLNVNGKQANDMLNQLNKKLNDLTQAFNRAKQAGDKVSMNKIKKEMNDTERVINQIKSAGATTAEVLRRLDKATPKELNAALRRLKKELNGIERGSAAWDAQTAKIRKVRAEIDKCNAAMRSQQTLGQRLADGFNRFAGIIATGAASITGMIAAGRKAVNAFVEMQEQLANTEKYTRMTRKEVEELNEVFKNMDTRLSRDQLNQLAQEAGRLGYNTVQSVKEYVEAASIINVALVDLGEGATQTIAKLTNIFGVEQIYGVNEAMQKVGSTVNHLSQNCTAGKQYIVEFAQRMAGIGSTAKMTIPEIMAFAATLDANGQKVEMSATALQRTIMALFNDTAGMAKKVGLDVREFTETLNKSTTEGVIKFLEALQKIGEKDALAVLSPLFQDLGLDGARVSGVLANLSSHLDMLKWQMEEASGAFRDGTSAINEYEIFNNTAQASIDKARKRISELAIELGEKLYPIMKHIYTSGSLVLRGLNALVSMFIQYKSAILSTVIVIASYKTAIAAASMAHGAWNLVIKSGIAIKTAWRVLVISLKIIILAFTNGIQAATTAFKLLNAAMKTNPFGMIIAAATALVTIIVSLVNRTSEFTKAMNEAKNTAKNFTEQLNKEMRTLDELFGKIEACKKGTKEFKTVKDAIISQYGKYLKGLIDEKGEIIDLAAAYRRLATAAQMSAKARAIKSGRERAQDAYDDELSKKAEKLQESLIDSGMSLKDAVELTNKIVFSLQTTGKISNDLSDRLPKRGETLANKWGWVGTRAPVNLADDMFTITEVYKSTMTELDKLDVQHNTFEGLSEDQIKNFIQKGKESLKNGEGADLSKTVGGTRYKLHISAKDLSRYIEEAEVILSELQSSVYNEINGGNQNFDIDKFTPYKTEKQKKAELAEQKKKEREEAKRKREEEAKARREAIKAKKEFKEELNNTKGDWEAASAVNTVEYTNGMKTWTDYLQTKHDLEIKYYDDRAEVYKKYNLEEDEDYKELLKKRAEYEAKWLEQNRAMKIDEAKRLQKAEEVEAEMDFYSQKSSIYQNEEALNRRRFEIRLKYLKKIRDYYNKDSEEYYKYSLQLEDAENEEMMRRKKKAVERFEEWRNKYPLVQAKKRYELELELLEQFYFQDLISYEEYLQMKRKLDEEFSDEVVPQNAKSKNENKEIKKQYDKERNELDAALAAGLITPDKYEEAIKNLDQQLRKSYSESAKKFGASETAMIIDLINAWKDLFKGIDDGGNAFTRLAAAASATFALINSQLQNATELMKVSADIEVARIEKKYDREIELAQGNSYKVAQAEKKKEEEIARIKREANRDQMAIQMAQAVAQMATNALNAYGSAAAIPVIGWKIAPIAAALALAAGAIQIATIKKQQELQELQGYSEGGFTEPGAVDQPAGVVHAGEWVASQRLLKDPVARPMIEALDYAQRNNRYSSLRSADVSKSITAPMKIAELTDEKRKDLRELIVMESVAGVIGRLDKKLEKPLVAVVSVDGKNGVKRKMAEYDALLKNKSGNK